MNTDQLEIMYLELLSRYSDDMFKADRDLKSYIELYGDVYLDIPNISGDCVYDVYYDVLRVIDAEFESLFGSRHWNSSSYPDARATYRLDWLKNNYNCDIVLDNSEFSDGDRFSEMFDENTYGYFFFKTEEDRVNFLMRFL